MYCSEVKELLSAYYDDELSSAARTAVSEHLEACDDCSRELEGFRGLSVMARGLPHPEPPACIWRGLDERLGDRSVSSQPIESKRSRVPWGTRHVRIGFAVAAIVLVAVGWIGHAYWFGHDADHQLLATVFDRYLEEFQRDPGAAQRILLANYEGQAVKAEQAARVVGYRPVVADGMPAGYSVGETYVLRMPCCACVLCLCRRNDGTTIAIFEHDEEEADWFGDRNVTQALCEGKRCSLVELDHRIAATWRRGKRHITVVGVDDPAEVERLVAWFDDRRRGT